MSPSQPQSSAPDPVFQAFTNQLELCSIRNPLPPISCGRVYVRVSKLTQWFQSETTQGIYKTSHARCLLDYAYRNWSQRPTTTAQLLDSAQGCVAVFSILLKIGWGDLIHLFRSHEFFDSSLPITLFTLMEIFREMIGFLGLGDRVNSDTLAAAFDKEQWAYCPAIFKNDEYLDFHTNRIIPIFSKEQINTKGGTATLWQIEVLEEFVHESLRKVLETSVYDDEEDQMGKRYNFALKVFKAGQKGTCDNEIDAFRTLKNHNGMVRYLGGFNHQESWGSSTKATHNILLEYGDRDLDELFAESLPPVLRDEINIFWTGLFEIADAVKGIHHLKNKEDGITQEFWGWHADIKPDNILEIQGKLKLADPGFARFKEKASGSVTDPTTNLRGGTHTFGAPERLPGRRGSDLVHQTIDIWSLGCVFSVAATWVVIGYEGTRQYSKLREAAIKRRMESQESNPNLDPDTPRLHAGDYFHDGVNVLPEVRNWHKYLRSVARKTDEVTHQVLDIVENRMLVQHSKNLPRMKASELCQKLSDIIDNLEDSAPSVPEDIVKFLTDVDDEAAEAATNVRSSASVETVADPRRVPNTFEDRQVRKKQNQLAPMMTTTGRSYLKSFLTLASVDEASSLPGQNHPLPPSLPTQSNSSLHELNAAQLSGLSVYSQEPHSLQQGYFPPRPLSHVPTGLTNLTNRPEFKPTPQDVFQAREAMEKRQSDTPLKEKWKVKAGVKPKPKDDTLAIYYENRDIKFLVDNATSMKPHWGRLKFLLETLVVKAEGLDEDGVDLVFSHGKVNVTDAKGKAVSMVMEKLKDPGAIPRKEWLTDMKIRLQEIFDDFILYVEKTKRIQAKPKKLTIIVLTDGIWGGTEDKEDVYNSIVMFIKRLSRVWAGEINTRPVSIQFIQFGKDPDATFRLTRLDDDMKIEGIPDLVDREHCDGDVNKMMLGSFVWLYDELQTEDATSNSGLSSPTGLIYQNSQDGSSGGLYNTARSSTYSTQAPPRTSPPLSDPFTTPDRIPRRQTERIEYTSTGYQPQLTHHSRSDSTEYAESSQHRNSTLYKQKLYRR